MRVECDIENRFTRTMMYVLTKRFERSTDKRIYRGLVLYAFEYFHRNACLKTVFYKTFFDCIQIEFRQNRNTYLSAYFLRSFFRIFRFIRSTRTRFCDTRITRRSTEMIKSFSSSTTLPG